MPNHVTNTLEIYLWHNDHDDLITEIRELICPKDSEYEYIDFNAIVPPPEKMFTDNLSMDDRVRCAEEGIPNWYDWQTENWGTKWNAYSQELIEQDNCMLKLQFDTAWAPPIPIVERLAEILRKKYPDEDGYESYVAGAWLEEGYQSAGVF